MPIKVPPPPPLPMGSPAPQPGVAAGPAMPLPSTAIASNQHFVPLPASTPPAQVAPSQAGGLFDEFLPQAPLPASTPPAQVAPSQAGGLFDEFLPQPSAPTGQPAGDLEPAATPAQKAKPPKFKDVVKKLHGPQTAGKILPGPPPSKTQIAGQQLAEGFDVGSRIGDQIVNHLTSQVPVLGPMAQGLKGLPQQAADLFNTVQNKGFLPAMGGVAAGLLPGLVGFPQDLVNLSNQSTRLHEKELQGKNPLQKAATVLLDPLGVLRPLMTQIDMGTKAANKLMGRGEEKPVRIREELKKAPIIEQAYSDPALSPATGMGEFIGGLAGNVLAPEVGIPVKAAALAEKPVMLGMVAGAVNAPAFGALSELGQQSQEQQQAGKLAPLDMNKAAEAGAAAVGPGALLGAGAGALGSRFKPKTEAPKTEAAKSGSRSVAGDHNVVVVDGQEVSRQAAMSILDSDAHPEFKQKVLDGLNAADEAIAAGKPVPRGAQKPAQEASPQMQMGAASKEQAAFEAGSQPENHMPPTPIGEGLGFDHIKDYNQGEWRGPQPVSVAGPKDPNAVNQGLWTGSRPEPGVLRPESAELDRQRQAIAADQEAKQAADVAATQAAAEDPVLKLGKQEDQFFPLSRKTFQDDYEVVQNGFGKEFTVPVGEPWSPRDMHDGALQSSGEFYQNELDVQRKILEQTPGKERNKRAQIRRMIEKLEERTAAIEQEQARRTNRTARGFEQDWPQEEQGHFDEFLPAEVPQNKAVSIYAGAGELGAPGATVAANANETPSQAPGEALNTVPEQNLQPGTPENAEINASPEAASASPRYAVEASPDKKYFFNLVDTENGQVLRSNKDAKQLHKTAENLNSGGKLGQGQRNDKQVPLSKGVVEDGTPLPEGVDADVRAAYDNVGTWKNAYDLTRARLEGVAQAIFDLTGGKMPKNPARIYNKATETARLAASKTKPGDFNFEVNAGDRMAPDSSGLEGMSLDQLKSLYDSTWDQFKEAETELKTAKKGLPTVDGESITWETGGRKYNVRPVPKPGTETATQLPDTTGTLEENGATFKKVQEAVKQATGPQRSSVYNAAASTTNPGNLGAGIRNQRGSTNLLKVAGQALDKIATRAEKIIAESVENFIREETGSGEVGYGIDIATLGTGRAIASSLAEGARKHDGIRKIIEGGGDVVNQLIHLRRTFDYIRDYSADIHNRLWEGIARETIVGRGVQFDPKHAPLLERSLQMDSGSIRMGTEGLHVLNAKQRDYLATRKTVRAATAKLLRAEIEKIDKQYQGSMPPSVAHQYDAMRELEAGLTGQSAGRNPLDKALRMGNDIMYDYLFKWNPAYHALNLSDPLVIGSSRVGLNRVLAGKAAVNPVLGDKKVRSYIAEIADAMENPMKNDQGGGGLLDKIPDMPSVQWNNRDMLAAGLMMHADSIKYKGGGGKFLSDLANGKLTMEQEVRAMVDALQVNNDVNGAGTHGLDKDLVSRSQFGKAVLQFTSQPLRQTRLLSSYLRNGQVVSALTFMGMQYALSGSGLIPKDVEQLWASVDTNSLKLTQDALDQFNLLEKFAGRSVTDKLRWAILPIFAGSNSNIAAEQLQGLVEIAADARDGQLDDRHTKQGVTLLASILAGGGGNAAQRLWKELEAGIAGTKEEKAYGDDFIPKGQPHSLDKRTVPYTIGQGLVNAVLPGKPAETAQWERGARQKAAAKNLLKLKGNTNGQ